MSRQKTRKSTGDNKKIHEHWYKQITGEKAKHWEEVLGYSSYENIYEGNGCACYACGRETGKLQRCHIIPHALGGSSEPDNIFLLCPKCHQDNPDTVFTDLFFDYVKNTNFWMDEAIIQISIVFDKLMKSDEDSAKKIIEKVNSDDFDMVSYLGATLTDKISMGCNNRMSYYTMAGAAYKALSSNVESLAHSID